MLETEDVMEADEVREKNLENILESEEATVSGEVRVYM